MFCLMIETECASYADDKTPCIASDNVDYVIKVLQKDSIRLFKWFQDNQIKAKKEKCHLNVSNNEHVSMKTDDIEVESSNRVKLPGIKIESKLNFKDHLDGPIKKAN